MSRGWKGEREGDELGVQASHRAKERLVFHWA